MMSALESELADFRIIIVSLGLFAGIALLLTAIGLYGVLAYYVSQRMNEIGIRMTLGASPSDMIGLVVRRGWGMVGIGLLLGVGLAYPGSQLIRGLLFGIGFVEPVSYLGAVLFLGIVAMVACSIPAWRATRVDPAKVLRQE